MAATGSTDHPLSFAFSYGFVGGPLHSRKFKRLMREAGYEHSLTPQKADIIIAHSAGCWMMPKDVSPKLVMYVGMPLAQARPHQTLLAAKRAGLKAGSAAQWLPTQLKSAYYGVRQPIRNINIVKAAKRAKPTIFTGITSVFIANRYDPWPQTEHLQSYIENQPWAFIDLPGSHDDIWQHSDRYVEIINHYAGLLA